LVNVHADLTNAYSHNQGSILSWTRDLEFYGNVLRVHDVCNVAPDVQPIFQLHVPNLPVVQADGSILSGGLLIVPLQPVSVSWVSMADLPPDVDGNGQVVDFFNNGYRMEFTTNSGCVFSVELRGQ
jgi:hypothetical protein